MTETVLGSAVTFASPVAAADAPSTVAAGRPSSRLVTQVRDVGALRISQSMIPTGASLFTRPYDAAHGRYVWRSLSSGRVTYAQGSRIVRLEPDDMVLGDGCQPASFACDQLATVVELWIGERELRRYLPSPVDLAGMKLCGRHPVVRAASTMLRCLWDTSDPGLGPDAGLRLVDSALAVMSTAALLEGPGPASPAADRVSRIKGHIERNLCDPALGVRSVAAAFRISPRYIHQLFAEGGESVSSYILRRRLEQCAGQLRDPILRRRTITQIAFDWGFNSMPHFARVFRRQYGVTARDYRQSPVVTFPHPT